MQMRKSQSVADVILCIPLLYNNGSSAAGLSLASLSTRIIGPDGTALVGYDEATFSAPNADGVYVVKFPMTATNKAYTIVDAPNPYTVTLDSSVANVDPMAADLFIVSKMPWELASQSTADSILTESQSHPTLAEIEASAVLAKASQIPADLVGWGYPYFCGGGNDGTTNLNEVWIDTDIVITGTGRIRVNAYSLNGITPSIYIYIVSWNATGLFRHTSGPWYVPVWGFFVEGGSAGVPAGTMTVRWKVNGESATYRSFTVEVPATYAGWTTPTFFVGKDGNLYAYNAAYKAMVPVDCGPIRVRRDVGGKVLGAGAGVCSGVGVLADDRAGEAIAKESTVLARPTLPEIEGSTVLAKEASIGSLQNSVRRAIWQSVPALGVVDVTDITWSGSPFSAGNRVEIWGATLDGDAITGDRGRAGYFDETGWHKDQNLSWAGGIFLKFVGAGAPSDGILLILYDKAYGSGYENVAVSVKAGDSYGVGLVLRDGTVLDQAWATWTPVRGAISADEIGTRVQDLPVKIWENTGRSEMPHLLRAGLFAGGELIEDVKYYREDGSLNAVVWTNPVSFVGQDIRVPQGGGRIQLVDHASPLGAFDGVTFTPVGPNWFDAVKFPSLILTAAECDGGHLEVSVQMRGAGVRKVYVVMPACPVDPSAPLWIAADGSLLAEWNYSWAAWTVSFSQYFIQKYLSGKIGADLAASHGAGSWEGVTLPDIEGSPVLAKESTSQSIKTDTSAIRNPGVPCTGLTAQAKSEVNAEVVDALETDTYAELMGTPPPPWTIRKMVQWLFQYFKHPRKMTDVEEKLYQSDGATVAGTRSVSETATQVNLGKME